MIRGTFQAEDAFVDLLATGASRRWLAELAGAHPTAQHNSPNAPDLVLTAGTMFDEHDGDGCMAPGATTEGRSAGGKQAAARLAGSCHAGMARAGAAALTPLLPSNVCFM